MSNPSFFTRTKLLIFNSNETKKQESPLRFGVLGAGSNLFYIIFIDFFFFALLSKLIKLYFQS